MGNRIEGAIAIAIAPSILLHSFPRGGLQLAFRSVVPALVEATLLFAEQLGEIVSRGGEVGRLLGRGRFHRQPGWRDDLVDGPVHPKNPTEG
jgi:hypothetical protein